MNKLKTYTIIWTLFLVISLLLLFTLPAVLVYYNGFSSGVLQSLGVSNEAMATLTKGLDVVDGVLPKSLGVGGIAKVALSYVTGYVPKDFPANNLPVKFWGSVLFVIIEYLINIAIVSSTLKKIKTDDDTFFSVPTIVHSIIFLVVSVVLAIFVVVNDYIYYVLAIVLYIIFILLTLVIYLGTDTLKTRVKKVDEINKSKKKFMSDLKVDVELLLNKISDDDIKKKISKLCDEIRYSDNMTNDGLVQVEEKIQNKIDSLNSIADSGNKDELCKEIDNLLALLNERNVLCKKFK